MYSALVIPNRALALTAQMPAAASGRYWSATRGVAWKSSRTLDFRDPGPWMQQARHVAQTSSAAPCSVGEKGVKLVARFLARLISRSISLSISYSGNPSLPCLSFPSASLVSSWLIILTWFLFSSLSRLPPVHLSLMVFVCFVFVCLLLIPRLVLSRLPVVLGSSPWEVIAYGI